MHESEYLMRGPGGVVDLNALILRGRILGLVGLRGKRAGRRNRYKTL